ncbi:MAG: hypothetical protein ABUK08_00050 [Candidatus Humimicrobiaceae bacterium]
MIWELEFKEKEFSLQAAIAKGRALPEWALNKPEHLPGDEFFLTAFYQLSSCRYFSEVPGPIPWDKIILYAHIRELEPDVSLAFEYILREMDAGYLSWYSKKQKALQPKVKKNGRFQR